jgi:hypothetical protein
MSILIDKNPQTDAKKYPLTGKEQELKLVQGEIFKEETFWACPVCLTDAGLMDIDDDNYNDVVTTILPQT